MAEDARPSASSPQGAGAEPRSEDGPSLKEQIRTLYESGVEDVEGLALLTGARPSYVGSVLRELGLATDYFDLYTSTSQPMNAYTRYFAGKLGFRDLDAAERSLKLIDRLHEQFERNGDRAGQHHALLMALTMFNRARWTGKPAEAEVFRKWLVDQLDVAQTSG